MFNLGSTISRNCQGTTRREILKVGGLGIAGLSLADWFRGRESRTNPSGDKGRETSCIFIFLSGGPSHLETFDPKPNAPVNIRGPYGTIPTNVPGVQIGELLPLVAEQMDKCALIRSMTSTAGDHSGTTMLSGVDKLGRLLWGGADQAEGIILASGMPPFVHVGPAGYLPAAGNLGQRTARFLVADPSGKQVQLPQFGLTADVSANRFQRPA